MKNKTIVMGAFISVIFMISSATAVPQVQSGNVIEKLDSNYLNVKEKVLGFLDGNEGLNVNNINDKISNLLFNDISDLLEILIQMIKALIQIILMSLDKILGGIFGLIVSLFGVPISVIINIIKSIPNIVEYIFEGIIIILIVIVNGLGCLIAKLFGFD